MDAQEVIHKLATDQIITEEELLTLLAAIIKTKEKQKREAFNRYLYHEIYCN